MSTSLGILAVVTGPSGAGKDSVIEKVRELDFPFEMITTTTTRPMRPGEAEGKPYYFLPREQFEEKISNGEMVEYAEVYGNLYGSTKEEVERVRKQSPVVIIRVDPQGARTFKEMIPDAITIFIEPPSFDFLEKRLVNRNSDSAEVIAERLRVAKIELQNIDQWDHVVMNDEGKLEDAAKEVIDIIEKAKELKK